MVDFCVGQVIGVWTVYEYVSCFLDFLVGIFKKKFAKIGVLRFLMDSVYSIL